MRPTERSARKPSLKTGFLATLRGLLHARGSGAPSRPRALAALATALGVLAFMSAPALAAAPEAPETVQPESVSETGAVLRGVLNPGKGAGLWGVVTWEFVYNKASTGECAGGSKSAATLASGSGMEPVSLPVTGLEPKTKYLVCLVASEGTGAGEVVGAPVSFITVPVQTPEDDAVKALTGSSAELSGVLNPHGEGESAEGGAGAYHHRTTASYFFRYSASSTECEVPGATHQLPEGQGGFLYPGEGEITGAQGQAVSVVAQLAPETTYTFCLVATQPGEEAKGPAVTFTTPALAPAISGEGVETESISSGEAEVYASIVPGAPPIKYYVEYGTSTKYGSSTTAVGLGTGGSPVGVKVRLGGLQPHTEYHFRFVAENEAGKKEVGEDETFVTPASAIGSTSVLPDNRAYELVSSPTENITVEDNAGGLGVEVTGDADCNNAKDHAAADGDAIAYQAEPPDEGGNGQLGDGLCNQWIAARGPSGWTATDVVPAASNGDSIFTNLYELVGGPLNFSNPLPEGRPEPTSEAFVGGPPETTNPESSPDFSNAISSDGSRIFWTSAEPDESETGKIKRWIPKKLYLTENGTTIQVDAGEAECVNEGNCTSGGGLFWTATADGSKVFFTDANRLTANSTAESEEPDLYEYEVATGRLTDLTVTGTGHANVQGVIGAGGENGEYVYFGAAGVLASNKSANGETAQPGRKDVFGKYVYLNIYVSHDGVTSFITAYEGERFGYPLDDETMSDLSRGPSYRTAQVSADGQTMIFEEKRQLLPNYHGEGVELYVYDGATGRLSCASCDPTGAPQYSGGEGLLPTAGGGTEEQGWPSYGALRYMSASGARVFFDSEAALVPQDTNGVRDVYEWERPASGSEPNNSCSKSSPSYGEVNGGCVYLLSGGQVRDASYFVDADAEGNNVFFTSRGQLTPQAIDENVALYDARVGGGFVELSTECTGTGCQGVPPAAPIFATPSSATFNGVGNFEPRPAVVQKPVAKPTECKKGTVRKAGRCVKAKGKAKAKRPGKRAKRRKK
jgi:hypothetical protein